MPLDEFHFLFSMQKLPSDVRPKAIEIANALPEEGDDDASAVRIAIAKARE